LTYGAVQNIADEKNSIAFQSRRLVRWHKHLLRTK